MPNCSDEESHGLENLDLLNRLFTEGRVNGIIDARVDDRGGRVTGWYSCAHCGMHYDEREDAEKCCRRVSILEAGTLPEDRCGNL